MSNCVSPSRRFLRRSRTIAATLLLRGLFANQLVAQTPTGQIFGRITDQTGLAAPNARIAVTNVETGQARLGPPMIAAST